MTAIARIRDYYIILGYDGKQDKHNRLEQPNHKWYNFPISQYVRWIMFFFDESYRTFQPFTLAHLYPVLVLIALIILIIIFKKNLRENRKADKIIRYSIAITMIVMEWIHYAWVISRSGFMLSLLPLGLCAISMYLTAFTLFLDSKKLFKIVFPWAIIGSVMSLLIADLAYSFPHFRYLHYFGNHELFLFANLYLVIIRGWRMTYRDVLKSSAILFSISVVLYLVNPLLNTNHMFLMELPHEVSFLFSWMGERLWVVGFVIGIFILINLVSLPIRDKQYLKS